MIDTTAQTGKTALLQTVSQLRREHVELMTAAIDQQLAEPEAVGPIANLGPISKKFSPLLNQNAEEALLEAGDHAKATIHELFSTTKAVQSARGDLSRAGLDARQLENLNQRDKTVKGLMRELKELGVYKDNIHHCIGLQINPPRRKPVESENQPLQQAVTALAASGRLNAEAKAYCEEMKARPEAQLAPAGMAR